MSGALVRAVDGGGVKTDLVLAVDGGGVKTDQKKVVIE